MQHLAHGFFVSPSPFHFLQKSQGLLKLKLYAKLFRQNAIRLISFEKRKRVKRKFKKIMNGKVKNAMAALLLVAAPLATQAKQWSLKDCIDYALANNISLQKTQLTKASAQEDYLQSKAALLPSLSASTNQSVNYTPWVASGISGDGFSRASIDKVYYNGNYSVS